MKVSICIATYNGEKYIKQQMDSILEQEFKENPDTEMEIIVSDDGSSDCTLKIIEGYEDERIKVYQHTNHLRHKYNQGYFACTENFSFAMEKANGDFIFLSDQDDVWYPWKVDKAISVLKEKGGVIGAAFDIGVDSDESVSGFKVFGTLKYEKQPFFTLRFKHSLYGFSCGMTRQFLKKVLPMPIVPQHDTFIMLMGLWCDNLHFIDVPCAMHRWSGEHNVSGRSDAPLWMKLWYRVKMWVVVIGRMLR